MAQDLVLAELPVGGVSGDETPQLAERPVNVLLTPTFPAVGGDPTDDPGTRTWGWEERAGGSAGLTKTRSEDTRPAHRNT